MGILAQKCQISKDIKKDTIWTVDWTVDSRKIVSDFLKSMYIFQGI